MTQAQRRVLKQVLARKFSPSPFDVPDPEQRAAVEAAAERYAETWIRSAIRDVLRVSDGEMSSADLRYHHPGA